MKIFNVKEEANKLQAKRNNWKIAELKDNNERYKREIETYTQEILKLKKWIKDNNEAIKDLKK